LLGKKGYVVVIVVVDVNGKENAFRNVLHEYTKSLIFR